MQRRKDRSLYYCRSTLAVAADSSADRNDFPGRVRTTENDPNVAGWGGGEWIGENWGSEAGENPTLASDHHAWAREDC